MTTLALTPSDRMKLAQAGIIGHPTKSREVKSAEPVRRFTLASWLSIYGRTSFLTFVKETDYTALERENAKMRMLLDRVTAQNQQDRET